MRQQAGSVLEGILRDRARKLLQAAIQNEVEQQAGVLGAIATSIYNVVTTGADLRAWYTLPYDVQIMRAPLPAGDHCIELAHHGSGARLTASVPVRANGRTVMRVVRCGGMLYHEVEVF